MHVYYMYNVCVVRSTHIHTPTHTIVVLTIIYMPTFIIYRYSKIS